MDLSWLGGSGDFADSAHWSPAQAPTSADTATIADAGTYSVTIGETDAVQSLTLNAAGATVTDNNELDLVGPGAGLTVQAGLFQLNTSGAIKGGVLSTSGSGAFAWDGGTLDGVAYQGLLSLPISGEAVTIKHGLTLTGAGGVGAGQLTAGAGTYLDLLDSQTLDNATLELDGGATLYGQVDAAGETFVGGVAVEQFITFGPNLVFKAEGSNDIDFSDTGSAPLGLVNLGTMSIDSGYQKIIAASFSNSGTLTYSGVEYYDLYAPFTNSSAVLVHNGANLSFDASVTNIAGGTITVQGGSLYFATADVTNDGVITVDHGGVTLTVGAASRYGDLSVTGQSGVTINGAVTTADLVGWIAGNDGYTVLNANLDNTGAVFGASVAGGGVYVYVIGNSSQSTITGGMLVGNGGDSAVIDGVFDGVTLRDNLVVVGRLQIVDGFTATGRDGTGSGAITVGDASVVDVVGSTVLDNLNVNLVGASSALYLTIAKADYIANGNQGEDQTLTLGPNAVVDQTGGAGFLGADLYEYDDANLVNQGLIKVEAGRLLVDRTKSFTNAGAILVTGGSFTVQATTLVNSGAITIDATGAVFADAIDNRSTITLAGGLLIAANLTGPGHVVGHGVLNIASAPPASAEASGGELDVFNIGAGAALTVDAGATLALQTPTAANVTFAGAGVLKLAQPLAFTGTLATLADGAVIDLAGLTATGPAAIAGSTVQIATSGGLVTLKLASAPTGAFTVSSDGAGGVDLTYVAGTIVSTTVGAQTIVQRFAASGAQTTAQITSDYSPITEVQNFDGAWSQTSATLTRALSNGSVVQQFGATWSQTGATITRHTDAITTVVQTFDGVWNQTGATITRHPDANTTLVQTFDGAWSQTGATRTYVGPSGATVVQTFDGVWSQIGATVTHTLAGGAVEVQVYDASWIQVDARITTPIDGGAGSQLALFDGSWNLTSIIATHADGLKTWTDFGLSAPQTFDAAFDHSTTFVFQPGTIDGDTLNGLRGFGAMGALHDVVDFQGYGPGAAVSQVDATTWQIASTGHATETFTVAAGTSFQPGDYIFT